MAGALPEPAQALHAGTLRAAWASSGTPVALASEAPDAGVAALANASPDRDANGRAGAGGGPFSAGAVSKRFDAAQTRAQGHWLLRLAGLGAVIDALH